MAPHDTPTLPSVLGTITFEERCKFNDVHVQANEVIRQRSYIEKIFNSSPHNMTMRLSPGSLGSVRFGYRDE